MTVLNPGRVALPVCPLPRSLATTCGISFDFSSSPYLDVSVQAVPHLRLFVSTQAAGVLLQRVPPFGDPRIDAYVPLPEAYRSLSRPSSVPDAKAFPLRSFQLDLVGADFVSFAPPQAGELTRSVAPPLRNETAPLGLVPVSALRALSFPNTHWRPHPVLVQTLVWFSRIMQAPENLAKIVFYPF